MKKAVVTTSWDDGHKLDLKLAILLEKYGVKGTFYISPENIEFHRANLLTNKEVVNLSKNFEIGAHTMTHPRLSKVSVLESDFEINESKKYLEKIIGKPIISFCYPGGDYNQTHIKQVKNAGYKIARTVKRFSSDIGDNHFAIPTTLHAYQHWSDIVMIAKFANFNPKKFIKYYLNWDLLAIDFFDHILLTGGVFHLWGHSWEIEKNHNWDRIENVLKHISRHPEVRYLTNGELI
jgi:peptidoglycan/xylan/chitin deacetylase (PgdA/CDA1 family)